MKLTNKILPYNLRRVLPIIGIATAGLTLHSCSDDDTPTPQHDIELTFYQYDYNRTSYYKNVFLENVQKYVNDASIKNIYLRVADDNDFTQCWPVHIEALHEWFTPHFELSPKVHGRGDLHFAPGVAAPADSLWFVSKGWTVNKHPIVPTQNAR